MKPDTSKRPEAEASGAAGQADTPIETQDWDEVGLEEVSDDEILDDELALEELEDEEEEDFDEDSDDDDNPYQESDEALPDDDEEAAIRRNLSREGGRFDEI